MPESLARHLTRLGGLDGGEFVGVDVGVSGGVLDLFEQFAPNCRVFAFDVLVHEVERLAASGPTWATFHCARIGDAAWRPVERGTSGVYSRSSAVAYSEITGLDYEQVYFNSGEPPRVVDTIVGLDEVLTSLNAPRVDFLKSDTDGYELGVLRSAPRLLGDALAVYVETNFDAEPSLDANSFSTISLELGRYGFRLFDLQLWRYARAALPSPFAFDVPAQTIGGQVYSGDGLFCRDLLEAPTVNVTDALKLASVFDHFGLQDCAAELLMDERVASQIEPDLQDSALTIIGRRSGLGVDPRHAKALFAADPMAFFPSAYQRRPNRIAPGFSAEADHADAAPRLMPGTSYVPSRGNEAAAMLLDGWHAPEEGGAWSEGPSSRVRFAAGCSLSAGTEICVRLSAPSSRCAALKTNVSLAIQGHDAGSPCEVVGADGECRLTLPESIDEGETVTLVVTSSRLVTPVLEGWSDDSRLIGVFIREVEIAGQQSA